MAKIGQHVLQQHADHQLVLDHEDAFAGRRIALRCHPKYRAPAATGNISTNMRRPPSRDYYSAAGRTLNARAETETLNAEVPRPVPGENPEATM
jgi:hypothetical protein